MSVPPDMMNADVPTSVKLQMLAQNLQYNPLLGMAAGLLQAGGPSRMPTSLGQALGAGLEGGQQFQQQGLQNAMQQLQLGRQMQFMNMLRSGQGLNDPNTLAQMAALSGNYGQASQIQAETGWKPVTDPQQLKQLVPGGAVPGQTYEQNQYTHELRTVGDPAIKTIQTMSPAGTMVTVPYDTRSGKVIDVGGTLAPKDYSKPLSSPSLEQQAVAVSQYRQMPPNVSSRDPGAADIRGRANYLLQDFGGLDDTTFPAKMASMKSLASGKDYQQNSAYSTIQTHIQTLQQAINALNNGDIQNANKLTQWAGKQFGKAAPQNAKVVNDIVVGELAKVLAQGGQVTDSVRNEAAGDLEPYLSKGQVSGAVQYIQQLIAGKMATSHLNAQANHIPDDVFMAHLSPEARQQLQMFEATHQGQGTSTGGKTLTYDPTMNNGAGGFH